MAGDYRLKQIAAQLQTGNQVPPVVVRELLSWFGAQRRGFFIAKWIRHILESNGLVTIPDFQSAYIDAPISFSLAPEEKESTSEEATAESANAENAYSKASSPYSDPTYRISKLPAANKPLISVVPQATLQEAVALLLTYDYSQLPVTTTERNVKGVISWTSIGTRLALGKNSDNVCDLMDNHQEIRADSSLFQAIPIIAKYQYVLVRGGDNKITGIVTASDLSLQFQQLAEPFLLLGEIENHIRRIISDRFSNDDLKSVQDLGEGERNIEGIADLTFGEYIRLLENGERWKNLDLKIDRATFCRELDRARRIRNDVVHFDPDGIPPEDLDHLRDFAGFLQRLHTIGVPS